jgi:ferric-dicitrate binding protein FerR (iron transport regulator)
MSQDQTLDVPPSFYEKFRHQFWYGKWMWVAAVVLFVLSFILWQWFGMNMVQVRTGSADNRKVLLPDASEVVMDAATTLRYRQHFTETAQREVWLRGAAAFSVVRKPEISRHLKPFVVHTAVLDIIATGTTFKVAAYNHTIQVTLDKGSIHVHFKDKKLPDRLLLPGETLQYSSNSMPVIQPARK